MLIFKQDTAVGYLKVGKGKNVFHAQILKQGMKTADEPAEKTAAPV